MQAQRASLALALLALAACRGGTEAAVPPAAPPQQAPSGASAAAVPQEANAIRKRRPKYGGLHFFIKVPRSGARAAFARGPHPSFIPARALSIVVKLVSVDGAPPPAGVPLSAVTNLTDCASGCIVAGPSAPAGTDAFALTIFDGLGGGGLQLASGSASVAVVAGIANAGEATMQGIPHTVALVGAMPSGSGGTPFAGAASLAVNVEDADNEAIDGTYAQPVTVSDADAASVALASGLTLTGPGGSCASAAKSQILAGSTDAAHLALCYGGLDIAPAKLSATTSLVTTPVTIGSFTPSVAAIEYAGALNASSAPEIDLYVANGPSGGSGSFATWTDSQAGWTNAPYDLAIGENDDCNSAGNAIGTFAGSGSPAGTSWQANAVASPSVGTCTATLTGGAGATLAVTVTYTTTGVGVDLRHARPR